jgi:hypothetical protein
MSQTFGPDAQVLNAGSTVASAPAQTATGNEIPAMSNIAALPFKEAYESTELVITSSGLISLAHGMGSSPKGVVGYLINKVAEHGYTVGDTVIVPLSIVSSSGIDNSGAQVKVDASNIDLRYGINPFLIGHWTSGASVQAVSANWRLVLRAYA